MTWDYYIIGFLWIGVALFVRAIWRGTPDHTKRRRHDR